MHYIVVVATFLYLLGSYPTFVFQRYYLFSQGRGFMTKDPKESQSSLSEALKKSNVSDNIESRFLFATDPNVQDALELILREKMKNQSSDEEIVTQSGLAVGSLSICVAPDPNDWNDTQSKDSQWLNLTFSGSEWDAIFHETLGVPRNVEGKERRLELIFQRFNQAIPDYPMLGRIYDLYIDISYKREEIKILREECLKVQNIAINPQAMEGISKLIFACDEALKLNSGLFFASN
jgi:hypothetical protein